MSRTRIPPALREKVRHRAGRICEYCLLHETDGMHAFHIDHVISERNGGPTAEHLGMNAERVVARSDVGAATVQLLGLNDPHRLALRKELMAASLFPSATARRLMV